MKNVLLMMIPLLLTGCAGMNSDFEFSKPATDSGYWMQQADEMTGGSELSTTPTGKISGSVNSDKPDIRQYRLIKLDNIALPVKLVTAQHAANTSANPSKNTQSYAMAPRPVITPSGISESHSAITPVNTRQSQSGVNTVCNQLRCYQETSAPFVTPDKVQRVWIAPYVSPDNNVHVGEIVYFVSENSHWYGME